MIGVALVVIVIRGVHTISFIPDWHVTFNRRLDLFLFVSHGECWDLVFLMASVFRISKMGTTSRLFRIEIWSIIVGVIQLLFLFADVHP